MREAVHISRQQLFLMREAVKHFTPTSVPDARSRHTFRANTLPSTDGNIPCHFDIPQETVYFVSMNIRLHSPLEDNGTFFRLQSQPQENSLSTFYILNLKGTHLSLDSQEDTSTPSSTSTLAVIYHSSELLRLRFSLFVYKSGQSQRPLLRLILKVSSDISNYLTLNYTVFQTKNFSNLYFIF